MSTGTIFATRLRYLSIDLSIIYTATGPAVLAWLTRTLTLLNPNPNPIPSQTAEAEAQALARGPAWDEFRSSLAARGYFRGELAGSRLHSALLVRAKLAFRAPLLAPTAVRAGAHQVELVFRRYSFTSRFWARINHPFIVPPICNAPIMGNTAIARLLRSIHPAPTPLVYATHHTILVMAISCKG